MVEISEDTEEATLAIVSTPDFRLEAEQLLHSLAREVSFAISSAPLPASCREDWFLAEWT